MFNFDNPMCDKKTYQKIGKSKIKTYKNLITFEIPKYFIFANIAPSYKCKWSW